MALEQPIDPFEAWIASQQIPVAPALPEQNLTVIPVSPSVLGNPEPPKPPPPPPPPVQQIGAAPAPTEIAGPNAPAAPADFDDEFLKWANQPQPEPQPMPEPVAPAEPDISELVGRGAQAIGLDAREPALPKEYMTADERYQRYAGMSPEQQAAERFEEAQALDDQFGQQKRDAQANAIRAEEDAKKRYAQALAETNQRAMDLDREAQELGNTKIDNDRWWNSRSTGQKVTGFLMAVLGGLIQGRAGGQNSGLALIQQAIDQDIEAQKVDLQTRGNALSQRRGMLQEQFARHGDMARAEAAVRVASLDRVIADIDADMQKFDPAGRQAWERMDFRNQLLANRQKALEQFHKNDLDRQLKIADLDLKRANAAKLRADAAGQQAKAMGGGGGGGASAAAPITSDDLRAKYKLTLLPPGLTFKNMNEVKQAYDLIKGDKAATEADRKRADEERLRLAERSIGDATGAPIRNADGSIFAPTEKEHDAIVAQLNDGQGLVDILQQMKRHRHDNGGANKWTSPGAEAEYKRLGNLAVIKFAAANRLSTSDEQSIKYAQNAIFGSDPSGYNIGDLGERIDKAIAETNDALNRTLKTAKRTGEPIKFLTSGKAKNTPTQQAVEDTRKSHANQIPKAGLLGAEPTEYLNKPGPLEDGSEKQTIDRLTEAAIGHDKDALQFLHGLAGPSEAPAVRLYAHEAIGKVYEALGGVKKPSGLLDKLDSQRNPAWPESQ